MAVAQKIAMRNAAAARPARASRSAVVVSASAEGRRAVLGGLLAGAVATVAGKAQAAATPVDLFDDRSARNKGFDIIYEARDLDLDQSIRDGLTQARTDLASTKARVKGSESKIDTELEGLIKKNYWIQGRSALRRLVGTLRFDLDALAAAKPKDEKKKALALNKSFKQSVEALDLALVNKNEAAALKALASTQGALDAAIAALV